MLFNIVCFPYIASQVEEETVAESMYRITDTIRIIYNLILIYTHTCTSYIQPHRSKSRRLMKVCVDSQNNTYIITIIYFNSFNNAILQPH